MGYSIDRTKVDKWGFYLTWKGRERARSIGVRPSEQAETARNYVCSRQERQYHSLLALSGTAGGQQERRSCSRLDRDPVHDAETPVTSNNQPIKPTHCGYIPSSPSQYVFTSMRTLLVRKYLLLLTESRNHLQHIWVFAASTYPRLVPSPIKRHRNE